LIDKWRPGPFDAITAFGTTRRTESGGARERALTPQAVNAPSKLIPYGLASSTVNSSAPRGQLSAVSDTPARRSVIRRVRGMFQPGRRTRRLRCGGLGCELDGEAHVEGVGEAFEDGQGRHGAAGFESGHRGLGHTGGMG
jgi:hypothetical protein